MPVTAAQRSSYADDHRSKIPFLSAPRHLAGPGDPRHVTHALLAAGWSVTSAPGDPRTVLTGPDHARHRLVLDPLSTSYWQIEAADWTWYASFGRMVPAEIVAGFTDRLVDGPQRSDVGPWQRMEKAGWSVERQPDGTGEAHSSGPHQLRSELIEFYDEAPGRMTWRIEATPEYAGPPAWRIWISGAVPMHLMDGLAEQFVTTAPVVRGMHDTESRGARQEPSGLSPEQAVEAHFSRVGDIARRARAQRRTRPTASLPAPAVPTTPASVPLR
ncbi:DUF317 domain-containing protein [Streptomyces sp. NPDC054835]|uniref:DUF317 domain-containing protein n=1 Tax=Streptomyces exfoliatus TaxID=1905 RepID=UPI0004B1FE15|nr:DUF317 domain-containing protein [Streptomyces exfoliatus]